MTPELARAAKALTAEIHAAFAGVSRDGGVSWSESEAIDDMRLDEERAAARASDRDISWTELLDDPAWDPERGVGGFSFLDPIGFRYYLPAAMIRCIRSGYDEGIRIHLEYRDTRKEKAPRDIDFTLHKWSLIDQRQRECIAHFLRYMIAITAWDYARAEWERALHGYWDESWPNGLE